MKPFNSGPARLGGGSHRSVLLSTFENLKRYRLGAAISAGAGFFGHGGRPLDALRFKIAFSDGLSTRTRGTWPAGRTGFAGVKFSEGGDTHFG